MTTRAKKNTLSFEQAMERLEAITARADAPDVGLEELISIVEEGMALMRHCQKQLSDAELRIRHLENPDNAPEPLPVPKSTEQDNGFTLI